MSKFKERNRKYIIDDDRYLEEDVIDKETGYTSYKQIETRKIFGLRVRKQTKRTRTRFLDKKEDRSVGYASGQDS